MTAEWDAEAGVWVATSDEVPGLATGADTFEALTAKLRLMVPELLELNGVLSAAEAAKVRFRIVAERAERARVEDCRRRKAPDLSGALLKRAQADSNSRPSDS